MLPSELKRRVWNNTEIILVCIEKSKYTIHVLHTRISCTYVIQAATETTYQ